MGLGFGLGIVILAAVTTPASLVVTETGFLDFQEIGAATGADSAPAPSGGPKVAMNRLAMKW